MATYNRFLLSGSTNGRPIKVAASTTPGTTLHTAIASTTAYDEVYLWFTNTSTSAVKITVEFGGTTDPDDHLVRQYSIPANSPPMPIASGHNLNNGLIVKAYASVPNVVVATGFVNRIS